MGRISPHQKLDRMLRDEYGQDAQSTQTGLLGFQNSSPYLQAIREAARPDYVLDFEIPARDKVVSYLIQEMMAVCSHVYRAHERMAGDASMDSTGSLQPFMIKVRESLPQQREKIQARVREVILNTKLGMEGWMRYFRMLRTGDAIAQKVFTRDKGGMFDLTKLLYMPTWEMFYNPLTEVWTQKREGNIASKPLGTWQPGRIVRSSFNPDHNYPYGSPLSQRIITNYRQYVFAIEDLLVASRTQSPRLLIHSVGKKGNTWAIDPDAIEDYKKRHEARGRNLLTDLYVTMDWQEVKEIKGNPQAVGTQQQLVWFIRVAMLEDIGMPPPAQDMAGRHTSEATSASYASTINKVRMHDLALVLDVVRLGLLLRNFDDVDIDLSIPPLGETESVRWKRYLDALAGGGIGYPEYAGGIGLKDWESELKWVEEYWQWKAKMRDAGTPVGQDKQPADAGLDGTDATETGSDTTKAEERRNQQRRAGKDNPSGA